MHSGDRSVSYISYQHDEPWWSIGPGNDVLPTLHEFFMKYVCIIANQAYGQTAIKFEGNYVFVISRKCSMFENIVCKHWPFC